MKPTSPTRKASPLGRADFHRHFTWEIICTGSSGKRTRHLDVIYKNLCYGLK